MFFMEESGSYQFLYPASKLNFIRGIKCSRDQVIQLDEIVTAF